MGWREVTVVVPDAADAMILEFLGELRGFGRFYGAEPDFEDPDEDDPPGTIRFSLDGNSSWLNDFTPYFATAARQIAADIDQFHPVLRSIAEAITEQLNEQLVEWDTAITTARPGREFLQRIGGQASYQDVIEDLRVHRSRLEADLDAHRTATGPKAWKARHAYTRCIGIDALGVVLSARRLRRVADDLARRLPGSHVAGALATFDKGTDGLVSLRNIAEHLDEYAIGRGRLDRSSEEPGDVFEFEIERADVVIRARSHEQKALSIAENAEGLVRCLGAAADHHGAGLILPGLTDLDFMERGVEGEWRIVDHSSETEEQQTFRAMLAANRQEPAPRPLVRCPHCSAIL